MEKLTEVLVIAGDEGGYVKLTGVYSPGAKSPSRDEPDEGPSFRAQHVTMHGVAREDVVLEELEERAAQQLTAALRGD